jgi:hypothetical protein
VGRPRATASQLLRCSVRFKYTAADAALSELSTSW